MILLINKFSKPVKYSLLHSLKRRLRFKNRLNNGPAVVACNLTKELSRRRDLCWDYCFQDYPCNESVDIMWVVNDRGDLRWAIENKERAGVRELWAGPNLVTVPLEEEGIITHGKIDKIIQPCAWTKNLYDYLVPGLGQKIAVWPAGTDLDFWTSDENNLKKSFLIYNKGHDLLAESIKAWFREQRINYDVVTYGSYSIKEYKFKLNKSLGMIWLSKTESQGLALLEAMAMGVPALCLHNTLWTYTSPELNRQFAFNAASSAPYFSEQCGMFFNGLGHFCHTAFYDFRDQLPRYKPREFLTSNNLTVGTSLNHIFGSDKA